MPVSQRFTGASAVAATATGVVAVTISTVTLPSAATPFLQPSSSNGIARPRFSVVTGNRFGDLLPTSANPKEIPECDYFLTR